jgi:amino-acid N-acetyltransferase
MSPARIVPAVAQDFPRVESLLAAAALPTDGLADQFPSAFVIARRPGELLGSAGLEVYEGRGLLRSLAVAASARSTGVGRALVEDRISAARRLGLDDVYLLTTTAASYFERFGFSAADRDSVPRALALSPEFARACPASAACLVLRV